MPQKMVFSGNTRTNPRWLADFGRRATMAPFPAKLDASAFLNYYGINVTVGAAGAVQGATAIPVAAIAPPAPGVIPIQSIGQLAIRGGSILNFGGAKFAYVTADVFYGAVSIPVRALPTALVSGDTSNFDAYGNVFVPSGILVGRTFASRDSGTGLFLPGDSTTHDEMYLTFFDVPNLLQNNDVELLRPNAGVTIKVNYLPGYASLLSGNLTYINAHYNTIKGVN